MLDLQFILKKVLKIAAVNSSVRTRQLFTYQFKALASNIQDTVSQARDGILHQSPIFRFFLFFWSIDSIRIMISCTQFHSKPNISEATSDM